MKKIVIIAVMILSIGLGGFFYFNRTTSQEYIKLKEESMTQSLRAMGSVVPKNRVRVNTSQTEMIKEVNVKLGDEVKQNSFLYAYDDQLIRLELEQAKAERLQAEMMLKQAKDSLRQAELNLELANLRKNNLTKLGTEILNAELKGFNLELKEAENDLTRAEQLYNKEAISEVELESKQYRLDRLKANYDLLVTKINQANTEQQQSLAELEVEIKLAQKNYQLAESDYQQLKKAVEIAQTKVQSLKERADRYFVKAPQAGTILAKDIEAGESLQVGHTALIIGSKELEIKISPDEKELGLLEVGSSGYASLEAYPKETYQVKITRRAVEVDSERGTIDIYLEFLEPVENLVPNMAVSVELIDQDSQSGIFIKPEYIVSEAEKDYIYLYQNGEVVKAEIEIKDRQFAKWQIDGVDTGVKVLDPNQVKVGQSIEITR